MTALHEILLDQGDEIKGDGMGEMCITYGKMRYAYKKVSGKRQVVGAAVTIMRIAEVSYAEYPVGLYALQANVKGI